MAKHFDKEALDAGVLASLERSQQQGQVGPDGRPVAPQLGDPQRVRDAIQRRKERREAELPA